MTLPRLDRYNRYTFLFLAVALGLLVLFLGGAIARRAAQVATSAEGTGSPSAEAPGGGAAARVVPHPVIVASGNGPPRIDTGQVDEQGRPITLSCASCHANFPPNLGVRSGEQLVEFHQGLKFAHGNLTCTTCHNADDYDTLRLADGRALDFANVNGLCAQCHTPQARDYERGAHGGMTGYWDRTRGPQARKGCIDCHDPHAPAFPAMKPDFKPLDRFLAPAPADLEVNHE